MDGDTGHIKMTRVFRTSIITQLNKIKMSQFVLFSKPVTSLT